MVTIGLAIAAIAAAALVGACQGCKTAPPPKGSAADTTALPDLGPPTARLYFISNMAGAIEPCGCTKDQLGGLDHVGAWLSTEAKKAPASVVVSAGPLFFMDAVLKPDHADQDVAKAEAVARGMKTLGLAAFAPSSNDWAGGAERLEGLANASGGAMLLANTSYDCDRALGDAAACREPWSGPVVRDVGGIKIGFLGIGGPIPERAFASNRDAGPEAGLAPTPKLKQSSPEDAARAAIAALKKQGADVYVALASVGRGEAKRIADALPELLAVVAGEPSMAGDSNTAAVLPPERIGNTIVIETGNHLQSIAVLDLFVRDGSFAFADATGLEQAQQRDALSRRIDDLHVKISNWGRDGKVPAADLDARRQDVARLEKEMASLDVRAPPATGSFFRYVAQEIRDSLGKDPVITSDMTAYYKAINEHNKLVFKDRAPPSHSPDQAAYVGVAVCTTCHANARKFWDTTKHAHAYETLSSQFKEYNLDCVSCHVTGYELPGGSTVTHVDYLKEVQCEVCHGPGSKHATAPHAPESILRRPKPDSCTSCHHPPHVEQFDAAAKMDEILGPGHGRAMK